MPNTTSAPMQHQSSTRSARVGAMVPVRTQRAVSRTAKKAKAGDNTKNAGFARQAAAKLPCTSAATRWVPPQPGQYSPVTV